MIYIVSQVELSFGDIDEIRITNADGDKCERCWMYTTDGTDVEEAIYALAAQIIGH